MAGKLMGFSPAQMREMWTKPSIDQWLEYFNEKAPDRQWTRSGENQIAGTCLWHADTNPSMQFAPGKHLAFCFACQTGRYNLFDFLQELFKQPLDEIFFEFAKRFNIKTSPEIEEVLRYESSIQLFKKEFVLIAATALQRAANGEDAYAYGSTAVNYLVERGVDVSQVYATHIGLFPTRGQLYNNLSHDAKPIIDEYFPNCFVDDPNTTGIHGGKLVFPYYITPQRIGRIKVKPPQRGSQPQWLGPSSKETRGFFGPQMYAMIMGNARETHGSEVIIVEGEMDQLAFAQEQIKNHPNEQIPVVCGSGGSVEDVSMLADCGARDITLMGDNDNGGHTFVQRTLENASQDRIRQIDVYEWPANLAQYNDPDDVVQSGDYSALRQSVVQKTSLREPHEWASQRVREKVGSSAPMTVEQKVDLARKYGSLLQSDVQYDMFKDEAANILNLKVALLDKHVMDTSTDVGFLKAIERKLADEMTPLTFTAKTLRVFGVKSRRLATVPLNPQKAMNMAMQSLLGMTIYDWVDHVIGIPDWVRFKETKNGPVEQSLDTQMYTVDRYFDRAVESAAATAKPLSDFNVKRQGVHYVPPTHPMAEYNLGPGEDPSRFYVVNGDLIFKGERARKHIHWEVLETPAHGGFLFEPDRSQRWTNHITGVRDLTMSSLMDPHEMFHLIQEPINLGWKFLPNDIHSYVIAGYIMIARILTCFPSMISLFFTAPSQSGKSTLMQGILSGDMYPLITMLEGTSAYDDYTAAFAQQVSSGSTHPRIFDEFEDPSHLTGNKKTQMQLMLQMNRNIVTGTTRGRGTRHQEAREQEIFFPFIAGGVHPMQRDVDANRFYTIEMNHSPGHTAPDERLTMEYGQDYFETIRRWTTLAPIQSLPFLMDTYEELKRKVIGEKVISYRNSRMARALLPIGVAWEWAGQPTLELLENCCNLQEERLSASSVTPEEGIFRAVFQTNAITVENQMVRHSLLKLLSDRQTRALLLNVDVGAYWFLDTDFVVLYPDKLATILRFNPAYRNMTNTNQIYQLLSRHQAVRSDAGFLMRNPSVLRSLQRFIAKPDARELLYVKFEDLDFNDADEIVIEGLDPNDRI